MSLRLFLNWNFMEHIGKNYLTVDFISNNGLYSLTNRYPTPLMVMISRFESSFR